jgi:glycosyltransferase involved in cell wall biosynthesis
MKIAVVSSNEQVAPPPDNVIIASQSVSSVLSEGLVKKGHEVYSIVGQGSTLKTKQIFSNTKPFFDTIDKDEWEKVGDLRLMWQLIVPFEMDLNLTLLDFLKKTDVDIVHFHSIVPFYTLPFALRINKPCVFTLHGASSPIEHEVIDAFVSKNIYFVPISNNQKRDYIGLNLVDTVYNGIPLENYIYEPKGGEEMVLAGRIKPQKGFEAAIEVALKTKKRLSISGDVRVSQKAYYYETIEPLIKQNSELIHFLNFVNHSMINGFFRRGKLLLFPVQWEEPFGLVLIEAMASGTPVVTYAKGSIPEVVKDGETGFIVNSSDDDIRGDWIIKKTGIEGLCEAVEKIYAMPEADYEKMRLASRKHVEKNFTAEKMVEGYEQVYKKILESRT